MATIGVEKNALAETTDGEEVAELRSHTGTEDDCGIDDEGESEGDPNDAEEQKIKAAIKNGLGGRSAIGQQFARSKTGGLDEKYKKCSDRKQKRNFRIDWARTQLETVRRSKNKSETLTNEKAKGGKYMTEKQIVWEEHDAAEAKRYVEVAKAKGGKWVLYDKSMDRELYWYVQQSRGATYKNEWGLSEEQCTEGPRDKFFGCMEGSPPPSPSPVPKPTPSPKPSPQPPSFIPTGKSKEATSLQVALNGAFKTRDLFEKASAKATALHNQILVDKKWEWANNHKMLSNFLAAKQKCEQEHVELTRDLLSVADAASFKKTRKMDPANLETNFKAFSTDFDVIVKNVNKEMAYLRYMFDARLAADAQWGKKSKGACNRKQPNAKKQKTE